MCGIAGIFHANGSSGEAEGVVGRMLDRLRHRGPDGTGDWTDGFAELGHRRLAILDLTPAGRQPMESACGRWVVTLNGEIYNHEDVKRELGLARLRTRTDTEVLLEAWARRGEAALQSFVGQFAFAIYDRHERRLTLARDRFGEKPLFYHESPSRLTFASTIAALLAAPWIEKSLDPDALLELVAIRYVVAPRTILAGIKKLPPGHLMRVDARAREVVRWWAPPGSRGAEPSRDVVGEFDHLLRQATTRCLVSDVPVALFLSDGIDSHGIAAAGGSSVRSLSYVADDQPMEQPASQRQHRTIRVGDEERLEDLVPALRALSEPTGDGVAVATWQLVRAGRPDATVFLCGHGGDEIMGGYDLNKALFRLRLAHRLRWLPAALLERPLERTLHGMEPFDERLRRLRRVHRAAAPDAARFLIHKPLRREDLRRIFGASVDLSGCLDSVERLYAACGDEHADLDRIQAVMLQTFLTENLMSFSDAAGMAWSAEIRMPYLDRDLVEFVLRLPPDLRAEGWPQRLRTKRLLRTWARGRMPEEIIRRRKRGFESGKMPKMLRAHGTSIRSLILDVDDLRRAMPGLEEWLDQDESVFIASREGTLWAILALAIWYAHLDDADLGAAQVEPRRLLAGVGSAA
ncbi:MAG: asparagine synthase (glutamine-hydrolyzing) [bacterium]